LKVRKKVLRESAGEKYLTCRGANIRNIPNFSETMQTRREWHKTFKILKTKTDTNPEF
jgi:hypothetical protein